MVCRNAQVLPPRALCGVIEMQFRDPLSSPVTFDAIILLLTISDTAAAVLRMLPSRLSKPKHSPFLRAYNR